MNPIIMTDQFKISVSKVDKWLDVCDMEEVVELTIDFNIRDVIFGELNNEANKFI